MCGASAYGASCFPMARPMLMTIDDRARGRLSLEAAAIVGRRPSRHPMERGAERTRCAKSDIKAGPDAFGSQHSPHWPYEKFCLPSSRLEATGRPTQILATL